MYSEKRVGVLLSGGLSRRFGEPKAFSLYNGKMMYQWSLEALRPMVDEMMIISHPSLVERFQMESNMSIFIDLEKYRGMGPLAGIYTAMMSSPASWFYVIPCDTPHITTSVYRRLENELKDHHAEGVIPLYHGKLQPLVSIYHRNLLPIIDKLLLQHMLRMTDLVDNAPILKSEFEKYFAKNPFININTKSELLTYETGEQKVMDN